MDNNTCPKCGAKLSFYDGALGYEALVCHNCGYYTDVNGETGIDEVYKT